MGVEHSTKVPRLCPTGDFLMSAIDKAVFLDDETGYDKETLKNVVSRMVSHANRLRKIAEYYEAKIAQELRRPDMGEL